MYRRLFYLALLISPVFMQFTCESDCEPIKKTATAALRIAPEQAVYRVGDTLRLTADLPAVISLTEPAGENESVLDSANAQFFLHLFKLTAGKGEIGAPHFEAIALDGLLETGLPANEDAAVNLIGYCVAGEGCPASFALVCRQPGVYFLHTSAALYNDNSEYDYYCVGEVSLTPRFEVEDHHWNVFTAQGINGVMELRFNRRRTDKIKPAGHPGVYAFEVTE
jgi:hypothetical protein